MPSSLRLLESPTITVSGKDYDLLPHKPVCLLVYLAYQGTWVSREILASLFWPEEDEASARHNLRMLLSRAKQLPWAKDLESEATRLRWQVQSDVVRVSGNVSLRCTALPSWQLGDSLLCLA
jgi:DNA-binding SARP family transcriptional activator